MTTILHIITGLGSGGAERMVTRIATAPGNPRQIVVSLMGEDFFKRPLTEAGIECHNLGLNHIWQAPQAFVRLVRLIRHVRPDLVMTWLYHADFLGTLAARAAGVKMRNIAWNLRCSNLDFRDYGMTTRWLARLLARFSPRIGTVTHNSHAGRIAHEALGYRPRRWIYTPNGFDTQEWRPDPDDRRAVRAEWRVADDRVIIGMIARFSPQKDFPAFFEAARQVKQAHPEAFFLLIGKGTDELDIPPNLAGYILALGERNDMPRLLRGFDIAILTSAYGEGFPNALGEAMSSGVPCVSTNVGDAALILGDVGRIVPVGRPDLLARALSDLIACTPEERAEMGAAARRRIVDHWSMERILNNYTDLWTDITTTAK